MTASVDALWLGTLQKLAAFVAHDLKGALNAASVNLEVVRSRSERESCTGADVQRFAVNSAEQMSVVIRGTLALLSLARGTRGPVEVSIVTKQIASLLDDMNPAVESRLKVSADGGMSAETAAPLSAVRLAVGECLLAVAQGKEPVSIRVNGLPSPRVQITPAVVPPLDPDAVAALAAAGIRIDTDGHGISIWLPGPPELPH